MEQNRLEFLLKSDPLIARVYGGQYCRDDFPRIEENRLYLINTCLSTEKGEHWLICHSLIPKKIAWLCSAGTNPRSFPLLWKRVREANKTISMLPSKLQASQLTCCSVRISFAIYRGNHERHIEMCQ